jgi:hypothetical protein
MIKANISLILIILSLQVQLYAQEPTEPKYASPYLQGSSQQPRPSSLRQDQAKQQDNESDIIEKSDNDFQGKYLMLGVGTLGRYSGFIGMMANVRLGGQTGVGFHAGIGFIPVNAQLVYNAGVKLYPKGGFFLSTQFGVTHVEDNWDYWYWEDDAARIRYYGPTWLIGYERAWGGNVKFGFSAAGGVSWEIGHQVMPMIESGLVIQLPIGK